MSKKKKPDKRGMVSTLKTLTIERTRVIGDMLVLGDDSESYYALNERLKGLNKAIATIRKNLEEMAAV